MEGFPPPTPGEGARGWGDKQASGRPIDPLRGSELVALCTTPCRGGYSCLATSWQVQNKKPYDRMKPFGRARPDEPGRTGPPG